ncbi:hypothetical protein [Kibdelosporangium phytohabitans]|uniref:Uncharacterized protein n=1 Tax=Kibdelosporangium phytohabitans TaxID=860235 RepID=A0A0N9HVA4_9PSEU|nr:hypothetical protein [Kibdelosporangium phytohabitans]ALG05844.1 hypothetical protein AOZ06_01945 [Kibdelosporangium phytohabitans]MBE1466127.1 hypothetical protein [Kibdelosporangium phytohabitans]
MNTSGEFYGTFGVLREHLTVHELPETASIDVCRHLLDGMVVTVQIGASGLADVAAGLVVWADTLTRVRCVVWRASGCSVHLQVHGRLPDETPVMVFSGTNYDAEVFGPDLAVGERRTILLGLLREWAAPQEVVA